MKISMRNKILFLLFVILYIFVHLNISHSLDNEYLDVKILDFKGNITISNDHGFNIISRKNNEKINDISSKKIVVFNQNNKTVIKSNGKIIYNNFNGDLLIQNKNGENTPNSINDKKYRGNIGFINKGSSIVVINNIKIEEYLYGVIPKEIFPSANIEALKAQTLAARSFAYGNINKHSSEGFNLCSTTHCQVYGGYDVERKNTNSAVNNTKGEYITYNNKIISTPYHSNSGGYTESSKNVWGGDVEYLQSKEDPYSLNAPNSNWVNTLSKKEISKKLGDNNVDIGDLISINILEKSESGRVLKLKLTGSKRVKILSGNEFRNIIGPMELKSTFFDIDGQIIRKPYYIYIINAKEEVRKMDLNNLFYLDGYNNINRIQLYNNMPDNGEDITFIGKGFGHGVGMSQYGAMKMGELGYSYKDIIQHYYTGVSIKK